MPNRFGFAEWSRRQNLEPDDVTPMQAAEMAWKEQDETICGLENKLEAAKDALEQLRSDVALALKKMED
ncbi:MAG: hypothetical protein IT443_12040 [Phycisphaeraceae bacterium]|nr:hypothetical protein [Phycisphaeraceae bacterium]